MFFDNSNTKSQSIKCNHPPGGSTNFSFGWGQNLDNSSRDLKMTSTKITQTTDNKENTQYYTNREVAKNTAKPTFSLFDSNYAESSNKSSSIKITYAPGGKSNIVLGSDSRNYDEYRQKK